MEPADGVDVFGLWESVDLRWISENGKRIEQKGRRKKK